MKGSQRKRTGALRATKRESLSFGYVTPLSDVGVQESKKI